MDTITLHEEAFGELPNSLAGVSDALYVPFLGRVIEVRTRLDATAVAHTSALLRDADFAELPIAQFENLFAAATVDLSDTATAQIKERVDEIRRQGL